MMEESQKRSFDGAEALPEAKKTRRSRWGQAQKQIQEQMIRLKTQTLTQGPQVARKLILDEFGRELDIDGRVLPMKPQVVSTLKVNQNIAVQKDARKILLDERKKAVKTVRELGQSRWFDGDLKGAKSKLERKMRAFNFVEKDTFVKQEQKIHQMQKEATEREKQGFKEPPLKVEEKKGKGKDEKAAMDKKEAPAPVIEWWDHLICEDCVDPKRPFTLKSDKVTHLVEHPVPIKLRNEKVVTHTMHLTPQERKKLRRLRRQERTQQLRDKIKMGVVAPPPPKVKMSNLMRVLGDEAIADPSLVERKVKMQIEARKKEHEYRNAQRKLPASQKKAKKVQKWIEKAGDKVHATLYKINELTGKRCLFKIEMNAQQFHLTGLCVMCPGVGNLVIVEGSSRAIKRYKKLMMKRIKWREGNEEDDSDSDEDKEERQDCVCIWEGVVQARSFKNWKSSSCKSDQEARKILEDRGCGHYWDMLHRFRNTKDDI